MAIETLDLGRILQTAEAIKSARQQSVTNDLQQQYLGQRMKNDASQETRTQTDFDQNQAIVKARQNYLASLAIANSSDPVGTAQLVPEFGQAMDAHNGPGFFAKMTPDDIKRAALHAAAVSGAAAGIAPKPKQVDAGGQLLTIDENTGAPMTGIAPITKTASPDATLKSATDVQNNIRTTDTSRQNNQATVGATIRGQNMTAARDHIPSGYEADPANPGALRPIAGGPHDPNAVSSGMDSRSSVMFNRVASSAQAATKAIQNIMELPISTSSGWFGTAEPGHGLLASAKNVLAQKVTGQEAQDFKTMVAGVSRNLSTIETAGLAPNGAITNSMNNVLLGEGDTQMTKLRKMAEMRQIVEENLKPQLANPKLAPAQKDLIRNIVSTVQQSVPFTHHDITLLQKSQNPNATISDFATHSGLPAGGAATAPTATGPNGQRVTLQNGQWVPVNGQ